MTVHDPIHRVAERLEASLDARTAEVEFQQSYLPGVKLNWILRCYGRGVCTIGTGVRCRYQTKEAAERAGLIWILDGVSPADQPLLARGEAA